MYENTFKCEDGFYGEYCNITYCNGKFSNHSKICSGFGHCSSSGVCNCDSVYSYGINCERRTITCNVPSDYLQLSSSSCNGRGLCNAGTNCLCLSANFTDRGQGKSVIRIGEGSTDYTGTILTSIDKSCSLIQEQYEFVYKCGNDTRWKVFDTSSGFPTSYWQIAAGYFRFKSATGSHQTCTIHLIRLLVQM